MPAIELSTTRDALLSGRVVYEQPAKGYRVSVEAPLLAAFAIARRPRPFRALVDLGAGPGAVGLVLTVTGWARRATLVELDPTHAALARVNAEHNACADRVEVFEGSVTRVRGLRVDLAVANPPWFDVDDGPTATGRARAGARAFVEGSLEAFVRAAARSLGRDGRLVLSFPASRVTELLATCRGRGLHGKRLRFVHPRPQREAQVVFLEAKPGRPGGLVIEAPLAIRGEQGEDYTEEATRVLTGAAFARA
ncbi:MAG: methyltransferase [Myxococcales bacterium]|nr:methyltransferase [Myxococcales bacterium]